MKKVTLRNINYELIKGEEAYNEEEVSSLITDYFDEYDYIVGDIAYDKLRLKGFCNKDNKLFKDINDYSKLEEYIKNKCAYGCKYFILKKVQ